MENYDDFKLADNFETIARAYSKSMKNKGFIFVKLEEEEFSLLLDEISLLFAKILACVDLLKKSFDCRRLEEMTLKNIREMEEKFACKPKSHFQYIESPNKCFLSLVAIENLLTIKLMILSVKSGELEFCQGIITKRTRIYADSFSTEGFILKE